MEATNNTQQVYVDGFVIRIKKSQVENYKQMATGGGKIWMKHGALQYVECIGDDLYPDMSQGPAEMGKFLGFPAMTNLEEDETIIFSFITYKDKAHRDEVNAKVMADPEMNNPENWPKEMPFKMDKMAFGGFTSIVNHIS
ncbi:MAG TPA: DUF1428 domain-containing protein [Candidatus Absconditabacterales bacterium]|nr:DUF1428 domain-containing protein [Candidatus Absconditabacterales bacterium]HMT26880.1 DUF1428 domain-containing protein [Candidatus Absconditabacterales bacterium]